MADQFGEFLWQGIRGKVGATITFTHGISPAVCQMQIAPQPGRFAMSGALGIRYGSTSFSLPDCRVDRVDSVRDPDGNLLWNLTIVDRRWRWRECGKISGCYNTRRDGGARVVPGSEVPARDLARLCLEEMEEEGFNIQAVPVDQFPEVNWDYELPAAKLAELVDVLGLRIVTDLTTGKVRIVKTGEGARLSQQQLTEISATIDPPESPDEVSIACPIRYQGDFYLEPWGIEADGRIVPINELSYTPRVAGEKTWAFADLDHMTVVEPRYRQLALQSVFRWFRLRPGFTLPGVAGVINFPARVLPLEAYQVERMLVAGEWEPRPAWLYGSYYAGADSTEPVPLSPDLEGAPAGLYRGQWSLDTKRGIVKAADPIYKLRPHPSGFTISPPDLYLRTACGLRDSDTRQFVRHEVVRPVPGARERKYRRVIKRDDIIRELYRVWRPPVHVEDNRLGVDREAGVLLDALLSEYETADAQTATYPGFRRIALDGAIQQVTWFVTAEGFAYTRASRNREELLVTPSFKERRLYERIADMLDAREGVPRAEGERIRRGRA